MTAKENEKAQSSVTDEEILDVAIEFHRGLRNKVKREGVKGLEVVRKQMNNPAFLDAVIPTIKSLEVSAQVGEEKKTILVVEPRQDSRMFADHKITKRKNPNKVSVASTTIPYIGRLEVYYYKDNPEVTVLGLWTYDGHKYHWVAEPYKTKELWRFMLKLAHRKNIIGQYTTKAVNKRIKRLKKRLKEAENQ